MSRKNVVISVLLLVWGLPPFGSPFTLVQHSIRNSSASKGISILCKNQKFQTTLSSSSSVNRVVYNQLPSCANGQQFHVAILAGLFSLFSQYGIDQFLKRRKKDSIISSNTTYTAHSIIALFLMVLVSTIGLVGWGQLPAESGSRLLQPSSSARWLSTVIFGSFLLWDIPISLKVPALRKTDVIIHHVVMMFLALLGSTILPMHYIFFYFGIAELSSIPLVLYDQVDQWIKQGKVTKEMNPMLHRSKEVLGIVTAVSFTLIRTIAFTKITFLNFLPDCLGLLQNSPTGPGLLSMTGVRRTVIKIIATCSVAFSALQLFWFSQIVKTILTDEEGES